MAKGDNHEGGFVPGEWGFDLDFQHAVELIADTPTTSEDPSAHCDHLVDAAIIAARDLRDREKITAAARYAREQIANHIDGYDRDDLGDSPDY